MSNFRRVALAAFALAGLAALPACAGSGNNRSGPAQILPEGNGKGLFGIGKSSSASANGGETQGQAQIGVNSFLWRAALDTLSFMPLAQADAYGGVITTDWYANPEAPRERFKATVYILDTRLRADGLKVSVNRQTITANGWSDAPASPDVAIQIENKILVRARELRLSTQG